MSEFLDAYFDMRRTSIGVDAGGQVTAFATGGAHQPAREHWEAHVARVGEALDTSTAALTELEVMLGTTRATHSKPKYTGRHHNTITLLMGTAVRV